MSKAIGNTSELLPYQVVKLESLPGLNVPGLSRFVWAGSAGRQVSHYRLKVLLNSD